VLPFGRMERASAGLGAAPPGPPASWRRSAEPLVLEVSVMPDNPFPTSLRRSPGDPRPLIERINAQILERIEEAMEMAGLQLMVELRKAAGQPAPQTASVADREEFGRRGREMLEAIAEAFQLDLGPDERAALAAAEAQGVDEQSRRLAGQVHLAKTLPDYWQRFEAHCAAYSQTRLAAAASRGGWLGRLLGG
jgi:hypothetical protein